MKSRLPYFLLTLALLLAACEKKPQGPPAGMPGMGGPVEVGVLTVKPTEVTLTQDLPGRISAFRVAEVRARVDGIVLKRLFAEGSDVKEGQVLYEIDPAPYQAATDSAEATLARAKATLARAEAGLAAAKLKEDRYKALLNTRAISKQEYDDALAALRVGEADVQSGHAEVQAGEAAIRTAKINLDYTKVTSPVAGRIGISQVTEGAYVQAGEATLLATVQQLDRVYVDVTQPSTELLRLKRDLTEGRLKGDKEGKAQVKLIHENDTIYPEEGTLEMSDVTVNAMTSSVTIRAVFLNPKRELLPGMFVRARLQEGSTPNAILVPQLAVNRNPKGEPIAWVIGANGVAEQRVLKTSRTVGNQWLISDGLKEGDQVIINNLQKLRPGAQVKAVPEAPAAAPAPAPATAIASPSSTR